MTTLKIYARVRAVSSIQALLSKQLPGSSSYRVVERALDLAFNGFSPRGGNVVDELLSEAKRVIWQQLDVGLITALPLTATVPSKALQIR